MINCKEAAQFVDGYLTKQLTPENLKHLQAHLEKCSDCRGNVEYEASLRRLVKKHAGMPQLPDAIKEQIRKTLEEN